MGLYNLSREEFHDAGLKNSIMAQDGEDVFVFADKTITNAAEVTAVLDEYPLLQEYDLVVFGSGVPQEIGSLQDVLDSFSMQVYALYLHKAMLSGTGSFNEYLPGGNYEFVCRCIQRGMQVYCVECADDTGESAGDAEEENDDTGEHAALYGEQADNRAEELAYLIREHMLYLRKEATLEKYLTSVNDYMERLGRTQQFRTSLDRMLGDQGVYEQIAQNTAPFFIISGDQTCYGVLENFANKLADALVKKGQAVITTNNRYGSYSSIEDIENRMIKAYVGFQAPILENDFFKKQHVPKCQFWTDNPMFFDDLFWNLNDSYYLLCQDGNYARYLRKYYQIRHALHFPLAGETTAQAMAGEDREYDVVFVGSYRPYVQKDWKDSVKEGYFQFMIEHSWLEFEEGLREFLIGQGEAWVAHADEAPDRWLSCIWAYTDVYREVIGFYRNKVIETILSAGIELDVFGTSWEQYEGQGRERLKIHPQVTPKEALELLTCAKVSLNIMTWHKDGMTERIANSMLCGAVCLSDETTYLKEHFKDGEDIMLFSLTDVGRIPQMIRMLLGDEQRREEIARSAYDIAMREHTWEVRASQLIELIKNASSL
ncbi:MAG: glycosyltransferase family 1 protein [Lachnospiraceae bacterium]|nr:glycosyltransferase family 1 protein [Lachnospiraceae bacterium]